MDHATCAKVRALASALLVAMATLAACGGDDDDGGGDQPSGEGQTGGEITVRGCNPENPLIPGNTAEVCGGNPQDVTTAKLIKYATEDAAPQNDIAESIETEDNQNFTVTLKDDYMFSDGTQVTAASFVDAWNYTAYGPNAQQSSYFFAPFAGYDDLQCTGDGEDPCAGQGSAAQGRGDERPRGRRRPDLHHRDQRAGLQPSGASGLHRVRALAGVVLRGPGGVRQQAGVGRPLHGRGVHAERSDRPRQEPRVLR